jgi:hypothetical protein
MILYAAADLIWATRIKQTADALSLPCRPVRSLDMLKARLADGSVGALILDLETMDLCLELTQHLRGPEAGETKAAVRLLAFGPHVYEDRFEQIRQAGADEVLTRGAFDRNLPEILQALAQG